MENFVEPMTVYKIGLVCVVLFALLWSLVLDRRKPPTLKEFMAKFLARAVFVAFFFTLLLSFFYLFIDLFQNKTA